MTRLITPLGFLFALLATVEARFLLVESADEGDGVFLETRDLKDLGDGVRFRLEVVLRDARF